MVLMVFHNWIPSNFSTLTLPYTYYLTYSVLLESLCKPYTHLKASSRPTYVRSSILVYIGKARLKPSLATQLCNPIQVTSALGRGLL